MSANFYNLHEALFVHSIDALDPANPLNTFQRADSLDEEGPHGILRSAGRVFHHGNAPLEWETKCP